MKIKYFIFSSLILIGCPNPPKNPGPAPAVVDTEFCNKAEQNLSELCYKDREENAYCCAIVAPTKKHKSFTQFCEDKQNQGVFLNPRCLAAINTCYDLDKCTRSE